MRNTQVEALPDPDRSSGIIGDGGDMGSMWDTGGIVDIGFTFHIGRACHTCHTERLRDLSIFREFWAEHVLALMVFENTGPTILGLCRAACRTI